MGEFDENGSGPSSTAVGRRALPARRCARASSATTTTRTTPVHDAARLEALLQMEVGQTYEVHWPHSKAGAAAPQPVPDAVLRRRLLRGRHHQPHDDEYLGADWRASQVYTIVNDEHYYDLTIKGMIVDGDYGHDVAKYTGSTTGTSRDNEICSNYTPITWQVDRKCHHLCLFVR